MENKVKSIIQEAVSQTIKQSIKEHWDKERKYYFSIEEKTQNIDENVMQRYYGIKHNDYRPILLKETTLNRILDKHGKNGFVVISADKYDYPKEINDKNTQQLIIDIQNSGYSYLPTYGGYINKETDVLGDFEPSFLVFNYSEDGETGDFEQLRKFALDMCGKYNQDSVMIKYPNSAPTWEDENGNVVSKRSSDKYWKNDPSKENFTSLQSREDIIKKEKQFFNKRTGETKYPASKRFTYDINECYVNPLPTTLIEEQRRKGEIMIWRV